MNMLGVGVRKVLAEAGAAGTGGTPPPVTPPAPTGGSGTWYQGLQGEDATFMQGKNYENLSAFVNSHRNLEKMVGGPKEKLIRIPDTADAPEWGDIYGRLGRPKEAKEYDLPVPQGQGKEFAEFAQGVFHKAGLSKAQGQAVAAAWNEHVGKMNEGLATTTAEKANTQFAALQKEWGGAFEQNKEIANQVANALGVTKEQYDAGERAFGVDGWAKMLHSVSAKLGVKLGEAEFRGTGEGTGFRSKMTPDQATERLRQLSNDREWVKKLGTGDSQAVKEHREIQEAIYAGRTDLQNFA